MQSWPPYGNLVPFLLNGRGGWSSLSGKGKGIARTATTTVILCCSVCQVKCLLLLMWSCNQLLALQKPEQFGFTPGKLTTYCILAPHLLVESQHKLYLAHVDQKKPIDSVHREALCDLWLQGFLQGSLSYWMACTLGQFRECGGVHGREFFPDECRSKAGRFSYLFLFN